MLFNKTKTLLYVSTIDSVSSFGMTRITSVLQHYLSYLNYLRVNEYCGAIESLHHYFDCHLVDFSKTNDAAKSKQEDEVSCRGFRYAALSMAALQYRFGHRWVAGGATGVINSRRTIISPVGKRDFLIDLYITLPEAVNRNTNFNCKKIFFVRSVLMMFANEFLYFIFSSMLILIIMNVP